MTLDQKLLVAHAECDLPALVDLYQLAADEAFAAGQEESGGFYLTHAWIFALEAGLPIADNLNQRLVTLGRA